MIYMMVGIQGSGKTTFAKKLSKESDVVIISTDLVRKNNPHFKEEEVWPYVYEQVALNSKAGKNVIFDATSITPKVRKRFMEEIIKFDCNPVFGAYFLNTDKMKCHNRVVDRNKIEGELYLPPEVVFSYSERLIPPTIDEGFKVIYIVVDNEIVEEING